MEPDSMDTDDFMVCKVHIVPEDDIDEEDDEVTYTPGLGTMMAAKRKPPSVCPELPREEPSQQK